MVIDDDAMAVTELIVDRHHLISHKVGRSNSIRKKDQIRNCISFNFGLILNIRSKDRRILHITDQKQIKIFGQSKNITFSALYNFI